MDTPVTPAEIFAEYPQGHAEFPQVLAGARIDAELSERMGEFLGQSAGFWLGVQEECNERAARH